MPITGRFRHTIDAKGRLIVPSRIREGLQNDDVVLVKWPDGCVAMFPEERWTELTARLLELPKSNADAREAARRLGASAHTDGIDRQGRITVPQELRDYAGIDKDVFVIGALDHGELWDPATWQQRNEETDTTDMGEIFARSGI